MTQSPHLALLEELLAEVGHPVGGYGEGGSVTLLQLGLDSLTLLELLMLVDERTGVELRVEEVPVQITLAEVAALIDRQLAG
jgi:aryl carrier-like protein